MLLVVLMVAPCAWYTMMRSPGHTLKKVPLATLSVLLPAVILAEIGQYRFRMVVAVLTVAGPSLPGWAVIMPEADNNSASRNNICVLPEFILCRWPVDLSVFLINDT